MAYPSSKALIKTRLTLWRALGTLGRARKSLGRPISDKEWFNLLLHTIMAMGLAVTLVQMGGIGPRSLFCVAVGAFILSVLLSLFEASGDHIQVSRAKAEQARSEWLAQQEKADLGQSLSPRAKRSVSRRL